MASANGLLLYLPQTNSFEVFTIPEEMRKQDEMVTNKFFSITEGNDGIFWIGTRGGGLVRFDPSLETFKVYTEKDGLPNNVTYKA